MAVKSNRIPADVAHVLYPRDLDYAVQEFFSCVQRKVVIAAARRSLATQSERPELRVADILHGMRKCCPQLLADLERVLRAKEILHARNAS